MVEKRKIPICPECMRFIDGYVDGDVVRYVGHNKVINSETGELLQEHQDRDPIYPELSHRHRQVVSCGKSHQPAEKGQTAVFKVESWGMESDLAEDPERMKRYGPALVYYTFNGREFIRLENLVGRVDPDEKHEFASNFVKVGMLNHFLWGVHFTNEKVLTWEGLADAKVSFTRLRPLTHAHVTTKDGRRLMIELKYDA